MSSGHQRSMNTNQPSASHNSARPNRVVLPHFSDILQPRSAAPSTSVRRVNAGQHDSHRPAQYTNLGSSEFPLAFALDAPTDDAVTPYIPEDAPRRRETAPWQITVPTTRITPQHINLITPAKLEAYDDLAIFAGPASPLPTVAFSPAIDLGELLWFYGLDFPKAKRTFRTDRDLRRRWCSAVLRERQCRACLHDHCRADGSVDYHVGLGQRRCAWAQCPFVVPHEVGDDKAPRALSAHMALTHFCQTLMCPLCKRALKIAKESGFLAYDVIAKHLATGLCLGLAKYALEKAQPVPRPNLGADPGIVEGEDAPRFRV
ncbi:uncharacterized protein SCHCODRAFT_02517826 [Schizophyllum commune H4-8]|uniref:Uncharacterized protein n=1 Tax=Schizophyllum commune (strain H4-8 / FGSC 9210) TaxID=578458 RepID=D8QJK2_SCHCM|nr:uncharacterized protein SCHCODRAFT_02517826 [Schizophyllum commune H4-8]KAI5886295.1 hypothetical protein SCHCODRAFT_02517826 [Schizophyllum commune H4-8]